MDIGFIGAGKVGTSLGKLFAQGGLHVAGYFSRHADSAKRASDFTGSNCYTSLASLLDASDALFLTVPDGQILSVYQQLREFDLAGKHIVHCSGSLSVAETFPGVTEAGAVGLSIHPLFPVASATESWEPLRSAWFTLEGDDEAALSQWQDTLAGLGLKTQTISGASKARYHAACVFSSNLMCALVAESVDLLSTCGFNPEDALSALKPLIQSNVDNILERGPVQALTGPVERADDATVAKNAAALPSPAEQLLYAFASSRLVDVAEAKHPERDYSHLQDQIRLIINNSLDERNCNG